ncbi:hypothetical protein JJD41_02035 [Oxynema sp. CENA135]|uniref:hypothetical protein n=1 Tax=Oxynema sp. CENA135 TaxID=984206 RepID=UPI00190D50E5|nr:hypothetical protein [Oxynema sp. CENA135]MBK4728669.1 hypothetical protein [Oxynema sp. CENA135]
MLKFIQQKSWIEFLAFFLGTLGLLLWLAPVTLASVLDFLKVFSIAAGVFLAQRFREITVMEIVGFLLVVGAAILAAIRFYYRLRTTPRYIGVHCPRCGSKLRRKHRTSRDFLIDRFLPVYRYRCCNRECGWEGLRVKALEDGVALKSRSRD